MNTIGTKFPTMRGMFSSHLNPIRGATTKTPSRFARDGVADATQTVALPHGETYVLDARLQGSYPPTFTQQAPPPAPPTSSGDFFGYGLTLSGDDLFIGAPGSRVLKKDFSGATYFYRRNPKAPTGAAWQLSNAPFAIPEAGNLLGFGRYAAGDGWAFVPLIGTPDDTSDLSAKNNAGEVLVFRQIDSREGRWTLVQKLTNPDDFESGAFGYHLSYSHGRLLVGGLSLPAAYVFELDDSGERWVTTATLPIEPLEPIMGILMLNVLISCRWAFIAYSSNSTPSGSIAVYRRRNGRSDPHEWQFVQTLTGFDRPVDSTDVFGVALALERDTLVVGAPADTTRSPGGAVYVFQLCDRRWLPSQKIFDDAAPSDVPQGNGFGYNVALRGGVLVVADPYRSFEGTIGQGVLVFYAKDRVTGEWLPSGFVLTDPDGFENEAFGAGNIVLTHRYLAASNNLEPLFIDSPDTNAATGRVLVWRVSRDRECDEEEEEKESYKVEKEKKHCRKVASRHRKRSGNE